MISGTSQDPQGLLSLAWHRVLGAYRPGTIQAQRTHFKTFLSVLVFYDLPIEVSARNLLNFEKLTICMCLPQKVATILPGH